MRLMPVRNLAMLVSLGANLVALGALTLLLVKRGDERSTRSIEPADLACPARDCPEVSCPPPPVCPEPVCPVPPPPLCSVGTLDAAKLPRFSICDDGRSPMQVSPLNAQQIAVHCGNSVHVFGVDPTTGPRRTLRIDKPPRAKQRWLSAPVRSADVSGDGLADLVVGFAAADDADAPRGGALVALVQTPGGGYAPPRVLAPLTVAGLALGRFSDGGTGTDIAVLHREDARVGRTSELIILRGGPSPLKAASIKLADNVRHLAAVDLDLDGRAELITTSDTPDAEVFHLGPRGELARRESFGLTSPAELLVADFNGDDRDDVLFVAGQLSGIPASTSEQSVRTLAETFDLTQLIRVESDLSGEGKGKPTLIGKRGDELVVLRFGSGETLSTKLSALPRLTPYTFAGLTSAGQAAGTWLAVFAADTEPDDVIDLSLTKVSDIQQGIRWSQTRTSLPDAPLSLRWTIP